MQQLILYSCLLGTLLPSIVVARSHGFGAVLRHHRRLKRQAVNYDDFGFPTFTFQDNGLEPNRFPQPQPRQPRLPPPGPFNPPPTFPPFQPPTRNGNSADPFADPFAVGGNTIINRQTRFDNSTYRPAVLVDDQNQFVKRAQPSVQSPANSFSQSAEQTTDYDSFGFPLSFAQARPATSSPLSVPLARRSVPDYPYYGPAPQPQYQQTVPPPQPQYQQSVPAPQSQYQQPAHQPQYQPSGQSYPAQYQPTAQFPQAQAQTQTFTSLDFFNGPYVDTAPTRPLLAPAQAQTQYGPPQPPQTAPRSVRSYEDQSPGILYRPPPRAYYPFLAPIASVPDYSDYPQYPSALIKSPIPRRVKRQLSRHQRNLPAGYDSYGVTPATNAYSSDHAAGLPTYPPYGYRGSNTPAGLGPPGTAPKTFFGVTVLPPLPPRNSYLGPPTNPNPPPSSGGANIYSLKPDAPRYPLAPFPDYDTTYTPAPNINSIRYQSNSRYTPQSPSSQGSYGGPVVATLTPNTSYDNYDSYTSTTQSLYNMATFTAPPLNYQMPLNPDTPEYFGSATGYEQQPNDDPNVAYPAGPRPDPYATGSTTRRYINQEYYVLVSSTPPNGNGAGQTYYTPATRYPPQQQTRPPNNGYPQPTQNYPNAAPSPSYPTPSASPSSYSRPAPTNYPSPAPSYGATTPRPAPSYHQQTSAPAYQQTQTTKGYPQPAPAYPQPTRAPAPSYPQTTPSTSYPQPAPSPSYPQPAPSPSPSAYPSPSPTTTESYANSDPGYPVEPKITSYAGGGAPGNKPPPTDAPYIYDWKVTKLEAAPAPAPDPYSSPQPPPSGYGQTASPTYGSVNEGSDQGYGSPIQPVSVNGLWVVLSPSHHYNQKNTVQNYDTGTTSSTSNYGNPAPAPEISYPARQSQPQQQRPETFPAFPLSSSQFTDFSGAEFANGPAVAPSTSPVLATRSIDGIEQHPDVQPVIPAEVLSNHIARGGRIEDFQIEPRAIDPRITGVRQQLDPRLVEQLRGQGIEPRNLLNPREQTGTRNLNEKTIETRLNSSVLPEELQAALTKRLQSTGLQNLPDEVDRELLKRLVEISSGRRLASPPVDPYNSPVANEQNNTATDRALTKSFNSFIMSWGDTTLIRDDNELRRRRKLS